MTLKNTWINIISIEWKRLLCGMPLTWGAACSLLRNGKHSSRGWCGYLVAVSSTVQRNKQAGSGAILRYWTEYLTAACIVTWGQWSSHHAGAMSPAARLRAKMQSCQCLNTRCMLHSQERFLLLCLSSLALLPVWQKLLMIALNATALSSHCFFRLQ